MSRRLAGGLLAVAIGVVYLFLASQIRATSLADSTGPAGLPKAYGALIILLGAALALQALFAKSPEQDAAASSAEPSGRRRILRAGGLLTIGIGYLLIVPYSGYILSIALLIVAVAAYQGVRLSTRLVGIGAAGALVLWATFVWLLGIRLPAGLWSSLL